MQKVVQCQWSRSGSEDDVWESYGQGCHLAPLLCQLTILLLPWGFDTQAVLFLVVPDARAQAVSLGSTASPSRILVRASELYPDSMRRYMAPNMGTTSLMWSVDWPVLLQLDMSRSAVNHNLRRKHVAAMRRISTSYIN